MEPSRDEHTARKPVIGLATGAAVSESRKRKLRMYLEAIDKSGGVPLELPLSTDGDVLCRAMNETCASPFAV